MFNTFGVFKSMGIPLIYMIVIGLIIGFFNVSNSILFIFVSFFPTYILMGILAPIYNQKTPYFASYIGSLTLSVINILISLYLFGFDTMVDSNRINRGLVFSTGTSFIVTSLYLSIRKKVVKHD